MKTTVKLELTTTQKAALNGLARETLEWKLDFIKRQAAWVAEAWVQEGERGKKH